MAGIAAGFGRLVVRAWGVWVAYGAAFGLGVAGGWDRSGFFRIWAWGCCTRGEIKGV